MSNIATTDVDWDDQYEPNTPTNRSRADAALAAIREYTDLKTDGLSEISTYIPDMLANIMHLCRLHNLDFDDLLRQARNHHDAERQGIV